jgi:hypothetical protein
MLGTPTSTSVIFRTKFSLASAIATRLLAELEDVRKVYTQIMFVKDV